MRSKIKISILGIFCLIVIILFIGLQKSIAKDVQNTGEKELTTGIAMMLETTAGSGEYVKTDDTSWADVVAKGYVFNSEKSTCKNGSTLTWNNKNKTIILSGNVTDNCTAYFDNYINTTLSSYIIKNIGTDQGDGKIVNENGYRYEGKNPNNYVKFNDELWRIIGVFDEETHGRSGEHLVKLIKAEKLTEFYTLEFENSVNNWNNYSLITMLNTNYYNNSVINACSNYHNGDCAAITITNKGIKNDATRNMIQEVQWKIGAGDISLWDGTAKGYYIYERGTLLSNKELPINLMYSSDYGYAVLENDCDRSITLEHYGVNNPICHEKNWLFKNDNLYYYVFPLAEKDGTIAGLDFLYLDGSIIWEPNSTDSKAPHSVIPTLYLKQNVKITGGTGESANPYTISL